MPVTLDVAGAIQQRLIAKFGGTPGLRDKGLLESSLFRTQNGYYQSLPEMAFALFEFSIIYHAFVDANKCMAFFASDVFLCLNSWRILFTADEGDDFMVRSLGQVKCDYEHVLPWTHGHLGKIWFRTANLEAKLTLARIFHQGGPNILDSIYKTVCYQ